MPSEDVSDLRDVVDAINRLCDTMKTSQYDDEDEQALEDTVHESSEPEHQVTSEDPTETTAHASDEPTHQELQDWSAYCETGSLAHEIITADQFNSESLRYQQSEFQVPADSVSLQNEPSLYEGCQDKPETEVFAELMSPEVSFRTIEAINRNQNWSDSLVSLPAETVASDVACEPVSEMYYTASSEVSLLSDTEIPAIPEKPVAEESIDSKENEEDRRNCVIAGHVAAMRERFESMTRANTPCPDLMRSASPSLDVVRNITSSPDRLG